MTFKCLVVLNIMFFFAEQQAVIDMAQTGSFGVVRNATINGDWLAPKNKQFSFYRIYPDCTKNVTKKICRPAVAWTNDMREYSYNGDYINFAILDDQREPNRPASTNIVTVTLQPLLQAQMQEDNLSVAVVCDKSAQTVTITTNSSSGGGTWQIAADKVSLGLMQLVDGSKILSSADVKMLKNDDMKLIRWYLNGTLIDDPNGNGILLQDISIDFVVLTSIKRGDAQTLFFTVPQDKLVALSMVRQII